MAVKILKFQSKFTGKEPLLTEFGLYNLTRNNEFDCTKAKEELGFTCRPFAETIKDEVDWLREEAKNAEESDEETKQIIDDLKEQVKLGDVSNIIVTKNGKKLFSMPVGASIATGIGTFLVAPFAVIPAAIVAYGRVTIYVEKKDGQLFDIKGNPVSDDEIS